MAVCVLHVVLMVTCSYLHVKGQHIDNDLTAKRTHEPSHQDPPVPTNQNLTNLSHHSSPSSGNVRSTAADDVCETLCMAPLRTALFQLILSTDGVFSRATEVGTCRLVDNARKCAQETCHIPGMLENIESVKNLLCSPDCPLSRSLYCFANTFGDISEDHKRCSSLEPVTDLCLLRNTLQPQCSNAHRLSLRVWVQSFLIYPACLNPACATAISQRCLISLLSLNLDQVKGQGKGKRPDKCVPVAELSGCLKEAGSSSCHGELAAPLLAFNAIGMIESFCETTSDIGQLPL